jgi:hypothetical protein
MLVVGIEANLIGPTSFVCALGQQAGKAGRCQVEFYSMD